MAPTGLLNIKCSISRCDISRNPVACGRISENYTFAARDSAGKLIAFCTSHISDSAGIRQRGGDSVFGGSYRTGCYAVGQLVYSRECRTAHGCRQQLVTVYYLVGIAHSCAASQQRTEARICYLGAEVKVGI